MSYRRFTFTVEGAVHESITEAHMAIAIKQCIDELSKNWYIANISVDADDFAIYDSKEDTNNAS